MSRHDDESRAEWRQAVAGQVAGNEATTPPSGTVAWGTTWPGTTVAPQTSLTARRFRIRDAGTQLEGKGAPSVRSGPSAGDPPPLSMATYRVNRRAVTRARALIAGRQYVVRSEWGSIQPRAEDQDAYLAAHAWGEYADWHLGLTEGANDETKARYAFVYGDFRRVHRSGLIACVYRAAEWDHKEVELAAHRLLQLLDRTRAT